MADKLFKIFDSFEVKEAKDDRTLEFVGSKEITDRDKEIVRVSGLDLKNYKKNPVVLWSHQYDQPPVGKATKVWKSGDELKFKVKFAEMEEYGFADTVYKLYKGGYMNAVSIGFIPDFTAIEYPEKGKEAHRIFNKSELIELSLVPVGANPAALLQSKGIQKALEDKIIDDTEFEEIKFLLEELIESDVEAEEVEEEVEEEKFIVESDAEIKPYENEHACRIKQPGQYDRFARKNCDRKVDGKCVDVIYGIKEGKSEVQALRFPDDVWDAADARAYCNEQDGSFEAAKSVTLEQAELKRIELGYSQVYCSECGKLIDKSLETTEDNINKNDGDNYVDELLSVLRAEKAQKKEQEEQEINELIQILKEGKKQDG